MFTCVIRPLYIVTLYLSANHVFSEDFSDENDAIHARFGFSNQVTANAGAPDNSLSRDQLQNILKRILFEPEGTDCKQL